MGWWLSGMVVDWDMVEWMMDEWDGGRVKDG